MRDIPMFTTENGVASIILKNVPYNSCAYIRIQDACEEVIFLRECYDFCKAAGAEQVFATGMKAPVQFPLHTEVWEMTGFRSDIPASDAVLASVTSETLELWRQYYNQRMKGIPMATFLSIADANELLTMKKAYMVYRGETCIGLGIACVNRIDAVISLVSGEGRHVFLALCNVLTEDRLCLEVASENLRAISLYKQFGFKRTDVLSRWYQISF